MLSRGSGDRSVSDNCLAVQNAPTAVTRPAALFFLVPGRMFNSRCHSATPGRAPPAFYPGSSSGSNVSGSSRAPMPTPVSGLGILSRRVRLSVSRPGRSSVSLIEFLLRSLAQTDTFPAYHDAAASGRIPSIYPDVVECLHPLAVHVLLHVLVVQGVIDSQPAGPDCGPPQRRLPVP